MPTFLETASAFRSRFRFQEPSDPCSESVRSSPALFKSASKEGLVQSSSISACAVGNHGQSEEPEASGGQPNRSFELHEDPSFWKDQNVQVISVEIVPLVFFLKNRDFVVIRIRPLSSSEISLQGYNRCVRQESCQTIIWTGHPESRFTFDLIADENVSQENLFKVAGLAMVDNCMGGYNSCMFAYGQTGSGKTHTMLGDIEGGTRRHSVNCGMTPRVFEYLFSRIQKEKESRREEKLKFTCKCSFLEIYNEQILDLLEPSSANLQTPDQLPVVAYKSELEGFGLVSQIREDAKKGVYVENLMEIEVSSARDVIQQLLQGAANRKVASTNMNLASSRSHSVFTCVIESKWECQGVTHHRFARLNLVDLAGSERQKSSGAEGERLKEATNINKSLSTLGCALETLSTLKFAQRAKFIRNNAIVNEDASGDVLSMRTQIQQLKKEINRLRGLVNGGAENQENDNWSISFPGSPGSFKWDAGQGSFSPLTVDKKTSQKREFEAALVGAFRREQQKDIQMKALAAENEAAVELAKRREQEIQSLKMRLRFREEGIKRLDAVISGKLSADAHLLQEKSELLKEIEVLRNQVDRNQEVTRFAMENLQLKEELRRLQTFCEEGEREMMDDQIKTLQNKVEMIYFWIEKLLEALDWKLMHEKDPPMTQNSSTPWDSSLNAENEFLRIQAIQYQKEVEALRKNLTFCLEAKEKLEKRVDELVLLLEEERKSANSQKEESQHWQHELSVTSAINGIALDTSNDQIELKTMVDAIAAASQREAEAHETAIVLAKDNEELRMKIKVLIEDNNKLIELYEGVAAEGNHKAGNNFNQANAEECHENTDNENYRSATKDVEDLEHQLNEMHEENEKLMELYEKAMQERDEFKRMLYSKEQTFNRLKEDFDCPEKLVEMDEEQVYLSEHNKEQNELCDISSKSDEPIKKSDFPILHGLDRSGMDGLMYPEDMVIDEKNGNQTEQQQSVTADSENSHIASNASMLLQPKATKEELNLARMKLEVVQDKLENTVKFVSTFRSLKRTNIKSDNVLTENESVESSDVSIKQQEIATLKLLCSEANERKAVMENKLIALNHFLSSISTSIDYWEQQEACTRAQLAESSHSMEQKKEEIGHLQVRKEETEIAYKKAQESEITIKNNIKSLKLKLLDAENQRTTEKVLFEINNVSGSEIPAQRNWQFSKAGELLKSEEERTHQRAEMRQLREKLVTLEKEIEELKRKSHALDNKIQSVEARIAKDMESMKEAELGLKKTLQEKEILYGIREDGRREVERTIVEYHQHIFESGLKEEEVKLCEEEMQWALQSMDELKVTKMAECQQKIRALTSSEDSACHELEKVEEELRNAQSCVLEAKSLLVSNDML
ncbi:hypothetical protein ACLOJK_005671 [Asimina triloba]